MAFGYEQRCPKSACGRLMSYEKCAGMVFLACDCGYERFVEDEWGELRDGGTVKAIPNNARRSDIADPQEGKT